MKKIILTFCLIYVSGSSFAQLTNTKNYVFSRTYLNATTRSNTSTKQIQSVTYFDGLGRPEQVVNVKASPLGNDVVNHIEYDGFGRQTKDFLPIPQSASTNGAFYANPLSSVTSTPYGNENIYAERILENSPLDRIQQQIQVGSAWQNKPVSFGYQTNEQDEVYKYVTTTSWSNNATLSVLTLAQATDTNSSNHCHRANQLYKNIVTDEDGNPTIEFKNGQGQTLLVRKNDGLKNADTYYVYNEYNQLAYVIPPLAVGSLFPITTSPADNTFLDDLCYQYRYDGRGRLVEKKLPGKGWEYMVYDQQDRLVLTQDANLRLTTNNFKAKGWLFTKYDQFGRVVYTGFFPNGATRASMQTALNSMQQNAANNEERTISLTVTLQGIPLYYDNQGFPTGKKTLLSVNYYDSYPTGTPYPSGNTIQGEPILEDVFPAGVNQSTQSLHTASFVKNIDDDNWTQNYSFYDRKGRAIGGRSINHLGGYTRTESILDFTGVPQKVFTYHKRLNSSTEVKIEETFEYDNQNRLLVHKHQVNAQPEEILTQNSYNEIGQLTKKKVGNNIQEIDYAYNIRGWMTGINVDTLGNFQTTKLFNYKIGYNESLGTLTTKPYAADQSLEIKEKYNGNIATVTWKHNDGPNILEKKYGYVYDKLNRLLAGFYYQKTGSDFLFTEEHNELQKYDLNGNISELKRFSYKRGTASHKIDDLAYDYIGNRLNFITDDGDFSGYEGGGRSISYDDNGNMIDMPDKGISSIAYNYLNLPKQVEISDYMSNSTVVIKTDYRADGVKIKKENTTIEVGIRDFITTINTIDYLDGFQYLRTINPSHGGDPMYEVVRELETDIAMEREAFSFERIPNLPILGEAVLDSAILQFFPTAEGFYDFIKNKYIYQYKDHLGNTRLSYAKNSAGVLETLDKNDYYPFGMNHLDPNAGSFFGQSSYKNYKYNGKELQETGMYDYGARMYMPDIGRWGVVDPLAEMYRRYSPYNYTVNNPINFTDPDGRWVKGAGFWNNITKSDSRIHAEQWAEKLGSGNYNVSVNKGSNGAWTVSSHSLIASTKETFDSKGLKNTLYVPYSEGGGLGTAPSSGDPWGTTIGSIPESRGKTQVQTMVAENPLVQGAVVGAVTGGAGNLVRGIATKKVISQFSTSTIDDAVTYAMENKVTHVFGQARHNLSPLVTELGGHENTFRAVLNGLNGRLPSSGVFNNIPVNVGNYNVMVRGSVVNGVPKIGTMFIP